MHAALCSRGLWTCTSRVGPVGWKWRRAGWWGAPVSSRTALGCTDCTSHYTHTHTHTHTHTVIITRCKAKPDCDLLLLVFHHPLSASMLWRCWLRIRTVKQEAQRSPSDRAMRLVSSNLANYHATVQKILIRQVLTKPMVWSWRFSWRQCVIKKTDDGRVVYITCIPTTCCGEIF